ncbi:MAG: hypothetical protein JSU08_06870 [Acidobacteria bacterium]|nr:hypothetical protein [Acidobacteriota bacterium]
MLQELATNLSTTLAVASLLFFVAVYVVVTIKLFRTSATDLDVRARMALDDAGDASAAQERPHRG